MSDFYNKYPYTDFHEMNLDWIIERVKKLTEDWLATQEAWNNTQEQWQQLHDYVMDYFANLDVQDEINNKIQSMISDGSFLTIVTPTINQTVIDTTTAWLADHITQPTTPAIDNTLTIAGAAADSRTTGQAIASQYSSLSTYRQNDLVLYNGAVYRAVKAITSPETFTAAHWELTNIGIQAENGLKGSNITISTSAQLAEHPDVNGFPVNSVVIVAAAQAPNILHTPFTNTGYAVITTSNIITSSTPVPYGGEVQIAIPFLSWEKIKYRNHDGASFSAWGYSQEAMHPSRILINSAATLAQYPSVNDLPLSTTAIVTASYASQIANSPYNNIAYMVITHCYAYTLGTSIGGEVQIAIPFDTATGTVKYRSYSSSWTAWKSVDDDLSNNAITSSDIFINSGNVSQYPNLGTVPVNSVVLVHMNSGVTDPAFTDTTYTLITTCYKYYNSAATGGVTQIAIPFDNANNTRNIRTRSYNGLSWSKWKEQGNTVFYADSSNFIDVIDQAVQVKDAIVYLASGTYNMFDSTHDEAYWKARRPATRYTGLVLKNNVSIIGLGEVNIMANYSGSDSDIKENFSIFNIAGSFRLENVKLIGEYICYIVHDDIAIVSSDASIGHYENVYMTHNGTDHVFQYGAPTCIGGGCSGSYVKRTIRNSVFSAASYNYPVSYHTNNNKFGDLVIEGNYLVNGTFRFWQYVGGSLNAIVTNNSIKSAIVDTDPGITCYKWNNELRT